MSTSNVIDLQLGTIHRKLVAYLGPYEVRETEGKFCTHVRVEVAMDPNWIGTEQVRGARVENKNGKIRLTLSLNAVCEHQQQRQ